VPRCGARRSRDVRHGATNPLRRCRRGPALWHLLRRRSHLSALPRTGARSTRLAIRFVRRLEIRDTVPVNRADSAEASSSVASRRPTAMATSGEGGTSQVRRCRHGELGRRCAPRNTAARASAKIGCDRQHGLRVCRTSSAGHGESVGSRRPIEDGELCRSMAGRTATRCVAEDHNDAATRLMRRSDALTTVPGGAIMFVDRMHCGPRRPPTNLSVAIADLCVPLRQPHCR